jgi:hypothetical protein
MIHEAGEPDGLVQKCKRCGYVLTDYTNSMVPESDIPFEPHWWKGAVEVTGTNPRCSSLTDEAPDCPVFPGL